MIVCITPEIKIISIQSGITWFINTDKVVVRGEPAVLLDTMYNTMTKQTFVLYRLL